MNLQGRDLKRGMQGDDVALLQRELLLIGMDIPADEHRRSSFGDGTQQAVTRFQRERGMPITGVVDAQTALAINALVDAETITVSGRVVSRTRAGVARLEVEIADRNVSEDIRLASTSTDDSGRYEVTFSIADLRRRGKQHPDLQALARKGDLLLGASEVRYNASPRETLNILVDEKANGSLASEHEALTGVLAPHVRGRLQDVKETDERQDITYLANKTGWDARAVAVAAAAEQISARTAGAGGAPSIPPPFFYALLRAGLPADESVLYQTDPKTVTAIWSQSVEEGLIPAGLAQSIPRVTEEFHAIAAKRALDTPPSLGLSPLKEVLAVAGFNSGADQGKFAELQVRHRDDPAQLRDALRATFGEAVEERLRFNGKLAYLTLNHAPLMGKLQSANGAVTKPLDLVKAGYYRPEKWAEDLTDLPVPPEIPGNDETERRDGYARLLAGEVRLAFPTATVAQLLRNPEMSLAPPHLRTRVSEFLMEHDEFDIGAEPVEQFLVRNNVPVDEATRPVVKSVKRIQRVYQLTTGEREMNALLSRDVDSAQKVVRFAREEFVRGFKDAVGGEANARLIHARAQQVHNAALNVAMSFLIQGSAPQVGRHGKAHVINPALAGAPAGVIAYPTLENLLGQQDFCACDHCRSMLSPAAYLVDLLHFLDRDDAVWASFLETWRSDHGGAPYPFTTAEEFAAAGSPNGTEITPLQVLLARRPDIQHLPLTCENTNTPLPYVDLVNEILEHFVVNGSLAGYTGHSTDGSVPIEELLANPQFVADEAYSRLARTHFPPPLPFNQALETMRCFFDHFEAPWPEVMEALRRDDSLERAAPGEYGWRDIWMEELRLSREEYRVLTDHTLTLQQMYGYPPEKPATEILAELSNARAFARRVNISFEELIEILKTRFVNAASALIPRFERLRVSIETLGKFKAGTITPEQFEEALAPGVDASQFGGNIQAWVTDEDNFKRIMSLITLASPVLSAPSGAADVEKFELRYADPNRTNEPVSAIDFIRLALFIRLWKKLGRSISDTDRAIAALYPADQVPGVEDSDEAARLKLARGILLMLPRLGVVSRLITVLNRKPESDLLPVLAIFAPIDTHGEASLYRRMFLSRALGEQHPAFADDGFGNFLQNPSERLSSHSEALRAAFAITAEELSLITSALGFDVDTPLTLDTISAVFRRGWLARALKLSVREFLLLTQFTGIDPFAGPDPVEPTILRLIELLENLRRVSFKPAQALYLFWNQDVSGRSTPEEAEILDFARSLRAEMDTVESEFSLREDPDGQIARARMTLVFGSETTDLLFGLLNRTFASEVSYDHSLTTLEQAILDTAPGIAYDDFRKRLSFAGILSADTRDALKALPGTPAAFPEAVESLFDENRRVIGPLFERHPELHVQFFASGNAPELKRRELLEKVLPELIRRRKRQQAAQKISAAARAQVEFARAVLDTKPQSDIFVLHAKGDAERPALDDVTAVQTQGLSAQFFFRTTATGAIDSSRHAEARLAYPGNGNTLPENFGSPGAAISGIWSGYLQVPEDDFFNLLIETEPDAIVALTLDGAPVDLEKAGTVHSNRDRVELRAGTLYPFTLTVENVKSQLAVGWETRGRGREIIPSRFLYPAAAIDALREAYIRFLKSASLAAAFQLRPDEFSHLAAHPQYRIGAQGWVNHLPAAGSPTPTTSAALFKTLGALLDFSWLKMSLGSSDERFLTVLRDPTASANEPQDALLTLTRWDPSSLDALLARFANTRNDLADVRVFRRLHAAFFWVRKMGISAQALIAACTNEPVAATVRNFQSALRARYEETAWLKILKPINDDLRALQRNALVAHTLHVLRSNPTTPHIDTPDKLFEFFLMDVQMEPCTRTSRIRHALSSVQLFIERALMNLEPLVSPAVIPAQHWEWMNRYRVWEANRMVFLFPENWLEPELRDDQSPFFKDALSELTQSDITEDSAAVALLNYLTKLDEVAKLEPCGICYEEDDTRTEVKDDVVHVVARTSGANRKYYYRCRRRGSWRPWTKVPLEIEDNPVVPAVWNGRLLLFWLRILQNTADQAKPPTSGLNLGTPLADVAVGSVLPTKLPHVTMRAVLCWSEYYNGEWQPVKTSDLKGVVIGSLRPAGRDRSDLRLEISETDNEGAGTALVVRVPGAPEARFTLFNTHSLPLAESVHIFDDVLDAGAIAFALVDGGGRRTRSLNTADDTLLVTYVQESDRVAPGIVPPRILERPALKNPMADRAVGPLHPLKHAWDAPFLYEDTRHAFFVTSTQRRVTFPDFDSYTPTSILETVALHVAPLVQPPLPVFDQPLAASGLDGSEPRFGALDPVPVADFISRHPNINRVIATAGAFRFGDKDIGPGGGLPNGNGQQ